MVRGGIGCDLDDFKDGVGEQMENERDFVEGGYCYYYVVVVKLEKRSFGKDWI